MLAVFVLFVVLVVLLAVLTRMSIVVSGKVVGRIVNDRHKSAEYIVTTGKAPTSWTKRPAARRAGGDRLRASLLKRLNEMTRYFAVAPVFETDEARGLFMAELKKTRERWSTAPIEDITGGEL